MRPVENSVLCKWANTLRSYHLFFICCST